MAIVTITDVPGADTAFADGMREAGVVEALQAATGFRGHWSGAARSGCRVIELWDSHEDHQAWYDGSVAPNVSPGVVPASPESFDVHFEIATKG